MRKNKSQSKSWRKVKLGDITGINLRSIEKNTPHKQIEYIDISSVGTGILFGTTKYFFSKAPNRARRLVSDGDTILSTVRPNRRSFYFIKKPKNNLVVSTGLAVLSSKKNVNSRFLYYIVCDQKFSDYLSANAKGSAYPAVDVEIIKRFELTIPSFSIQQKIASVLSAYDDLIEVNSKKIKNLEEMAQAIFKEWFVKFKFPGYEKVKFKNGIPEGWENTKVGSLIKRVQSGKKYDNKTASEKGEIPILDQGRSGIIGYHNNEPGVVAGEENPIIVFANHTCYQNLIMFPFSAIQNVLPFYPNEENHRNIYWLHWATKDLIKFNDYKGHWPEFVAKKLLLPSVNLCNKFGDTIELMIALKYKLEKMNNNLRKTRDLLLPKLMSGEISV